MARPPQTGSVADLEIEWNGCYPLHNGRGGPDSGKRQLIAQTDSWALTFWTVGIDTGRHCIAPSLQDHSDYQGMVSSFSQCFECHVTLQMDIWALVHPCPSAGDLESLTVHKLIIYAVRVLPETRLPHGFGCLTNRSFPLVCDVRPDSSGNQIGNAVVWRGNGQWRKGFMFDECSLDNK